MYRRIELIIHFTEEGGTASAFLRGLCGVGNDEVVNVLAVEEHDVDVIYKDEYQVCIRPKRKYQYQRGKAI